MTCGIILLGVFAVLCAAGSLIPQNREAMYYVRQYPERYDLIFRFGLDHIYTGRIFMIVVVLLCLNLLLCSVFRYRRVSQEDVIRNAAQMKSDIKLDAADVERVERFFADHKCKCKVIHFSSSFDFW